MAVNSFSVSGAGDLFLNASEIAGGYATTYTLSNTGSFGDDVLILVKDGSGNLLYWYTETSQTAATLPAGALGSYQGTIQIQAYQGTAQTDGANSGNYSGVFKTYPSSSQFTFHDASLAGGNTAVTSGTSADATSGSLTLDTLVVAPSGLDLAAADDSNINNDNITNHTSALTINGSGENGASVILYDDANNDGQRQVGEAIITTTTVGGGTFSADISLTEGVHHIRAIQTDVAGNISPSSSSLDITVDTTAAAAPGALDLAAADDTGLSNSDNLTNQTSGLTITGTGENGATVTLFDDANGNNVKDGGEATLATAVVSGGTFSADIALAQGLHQIRAFQTDVAGNISDNTTILDITVNTTPPTIVGGGSQSVNFAEGTSASTVVYDANATDADGNNPITYSITGGDSGKFSINSSTGEIRFLSSPDFENPTDSNTNNSYLFTLHATDSAGNDQTQSVTVNVTNVAPALKASNAFSISEGNTFVGDVDVVGSNDTTGVTYVILNGVGDGADAAKFTINANTGVLSFVSAPNFESPTDSGGNNVYDVTVLATDGVNTTQQTFNIGVTNVAPTITSSNAFNVDENTTGVTTVTATDPAGGTLTYSIVNTAGTDFSKFSIDSSTGVLTFNSAPNFEAPTDIGGPDGDNIYLVNVRVSDGTAFSGTQTISVTVNNVNEAPVITSNGGGATASVNAAENQTAVTQVTSTDQDAGATATYSILTTSGTDFSKFSIDSSTGVVTFNAPPNFENPQDVGGAIGDNAYVINVQVSDSLGGTDVQTITVTVTNVNEAPVITSNGGGATALVNVNENQTAVTTVAAGDVDAGTTLHYFILGTAGTDFASFTIDANTGVLTFQSAPNFENPLDIGGTPGDNNYIVDVQATDGLLTAVQTITVHVNNVNEAPSITSSNTFNAAENQTSVGTVTSTDPDAGASVTYSIVGGADGAKFSVGSSNGVLSFLTAPDFEHKTDANNDGVYVVNVQASDGLGGTTTQAINVTVTDVALGLKSAGAFTSFFEGSTSVGNVNAPGADTVGVTYSLAPGNPNDEALFSINATTGQLSFISAPDFENPTDGNHDGHYIVSVVADDNANNQVTQTFDILVNNLAPGLKANNAFGTLNQGTVAVGSVGADDTSSVTYTITGGNDQFKFAINSLTGALSFTQPATFSGDSNGDHIYDVTVSANDGTTLVTQTFNIEVNNSGPIVIPPIIGTPQADNPLNGTASGETINGKGGNDVIHGLGGNDIIIGAGGKDTLFGEEGADVFKFNKVGESKVGAQRDTISDFEHGVDLINLRSIDANTLKANDQNFVWIGKQAFHQKAGELHIIKKGTGHFFVEGDTNGDGKADFQINVHTNSTLDIADFVR